MHARVWTSLFAALMLTVSSSLALAQQEPPTVEISGRVVDEQGNGIAGTAVATYWHSMEGGPLAATVKAVTDSEGRFTHKFNIYRFPAVLTVVDHERKIGGTVLIEEDPEGALVTIVAKPLARLRFIPKFDGPPQGLGMYLRFADSQTIVAYARVNEGLDILVPAGDLEIYVYSLYTDTVRHDVNLQAGKETLVDDVTMKVTGLGRSFGKLALPLTVAESRGVARDFKLADLKGKWVLLEFWGFW